MIPLKKYRLQLRGMVPFLAKFAVDMTLWVSAAPLAFLLRVDDLQKYATAILFYTLLGTPLKAVLLWRQGLYRQGWRKVGLRDLKLLLEATGGFATGMFVLVWVWYTFRFGVAFALPRSIPLIEFLVAVSLMGGGRFGARWIHESVNKQKRLGEGRKVLIIGAGEAGTLAAREMLRHTESGLIPIGFLDDDSAKQHMQLLGVPVLGVLNDLPHIVRSRQVDEVLIAIPSASGQVIRRIVELCRLAQVPYRIVPAFHEIIAGKVLTQIREVRLEDLLRREPVELDMQGIASMIAGKRVLVTGAGGSIGSEIVRQVARFQPEGMVLLGRGENSLFLLMNEINRDMPGTNYQVVVADVRDRDRLRQVFRESRPEIVFHAAAHKHVPLMEWNPEDAILNNVFGTLNVVELAQEFHVTRLVNISTDKAVNPTSVMGATKRVAEYIVQAIAQRAGSEQEFVSVRFGNVLGSRGSVVGIFQEQIRRGGPVTVTHPDMKRYFMTIPEAVQLVLQAAYLGENGSVYVLDMGEPVKIVDLARTLIQLSGYSEEQIPIVFVGLRPGEKLFEELLTAEEGVTVTRHEKIFRARVRPVDEQWLRENLSRLQTLARKGDETGIRRTLREMIPTYRAWQNPSQEE